MNEYIEERHNILNPFVPNREFPNRPVPSPFVKSLKPPQPKEATWKPDMTFKNLEMEVRDTFSTKGFYKPKQQRLCPRIRHLPNLHW